MLKVGILTFHNKDNYGAVLQAYALQMYLRSIGCAVEIINFIPRESNYRVIDWIGRTPYTTFLKWKKQMKRIAGLERNLAKSKVFAEFRETYLNISSVLYPSISSLKKSTPDVDILVVGSDQIWSPKLVRDKDYSTFWLDFGPECIKKIAYAGSFGGEYGDRKSYSNISKWALSFSAISARERNAVEFLHSLNVKFASWAPDPAFLLDWSRAVKNDFSLRRKGIGRFVLNSRNQCSADKIEKQLISIEDYRRESPVDINSANLSPLDWVKCISTLKFLITDSFHGTVFCLITNTPFIAILWEGAEVSRNDRVVSLLDEFGLKHLAVSANLTESLDSFEKQKIDWDKVNSKMHEVRQQGTSFLEKSIS